MMNIRFLLKFRKSLVILSLGVGFTPLHFTQAAGELSANCDFQEKLETTEGLQILSLCERFGSPFFIRNEAYIRSCARVVICQAKATLPTAEICFAQKNWNERLVYNCLYHVTQGQLTKEDVDRCARTKSHKSWAVLKCLAGSYREATPKSDGRRAP